MIDYGRSWVEKSHTWDLGFVPSLFPLEMFGWITRDRAGPLGGKCRTIGWEGQGVVLADRHLQGCIPRLCRLRTDGLAPASKYWTYRSHAGDTGPVSLVAWLKSTASLIGLGEKLGMDPWIGESACCGLCWVPFFSGVVGSVQICRWLMKGYHVRGLFEGSVHRAYVDWCGKCMCHVDWVFPCRLYLDSNCRDSRIWVTACSWQSSHS
jgi:hypothetical protein